VSGQLHALAASSLEKELYVDIRIDGACLVAKGILSHAKKETEILCRRSVSFMVNHWLQKQQARN
jgi:hypothetical protein